MILDGKLVASSIKEQLKQEIASSVHPPHLAIITIGENQASQVYVRNKLKACEEVGIKASHITYSADEPIDNIKRNIEILNRDFDINGIMIQLPLPEGYDERELIDMIDPDKDVDGLTTINIGRLRSGQSCLLPCTAAGIIDLLKYYNITIDGKDVVIIGRSNIVGKPVADLLMREGATIMQCHSHTKNLDSHTLKGDILISAIGKPKFITEDMIKTGATVIDVGINRDENGKLCGDVDYEEVWVIAENITPVPGGVGPMTVAELMKNTVEAWKKNNY